MKKFNPEKFINNMVKDIEEKIDSKEPEIIELTDDNLEDFIREYNIPEAHADILRGKTNIWDI